MELGLVKCTCGHQLTNAEPALILSLAVPPGASNLYDLLRENYPPNPVPIPDYKCDACGKTNVSRKMSLARLPEILVIQIGRFNAASAKSTDKIEFPLDDIDMEPYYLPKADRSFGNESSKEHCWGQQFKYRCYGIVVHVGTSIHSGHYYSYVRTENMKDRHTWYLCNDTQVTEVRLTGPTLDTVFRKGNAVPYVLFLQRKASR